MRQEMKGIIEGRSKQKESKENSLSLLHPGMTWYVFITDSAGKAKVFFAFHHPLASV